jgi:hypothetical protein
MNTRRSTFDVRRSSKNAAGRSPRRSDDARRTANGERRDNAHAA